MPKRKTNPTRVRTKLAQVRVESKVTQEELSRATGIGLRALQELERGRVLNPGLHTLGRIAHALDVPLEDICEDRWVAFSTHYRQLSGWNRWEEVPVPKIVERENGSIVKRRWV